MGMRYVMIIEGKCKGRLCYFTSTITKTHNYIDYPVVCYPVGKNPYRIIIKKTAIKELTKSQFNLVKVADKYGSMD